MNLKDVKIEKKSDLERNITITVSAEDITKIMNENTQKAAKNAKLDGFRPGKAPIAVIKQKFEEQIMAETMQTVVSSSLTKVITDEKFDIATQPHVHHTEFKEGEDYTFSAHFEIMPEVEPKGYAKVKLTKEVAKADDELTNELLGKFLESQVEYKAKRADAKAKDGDQIKMNAVGFKDGVAFEGGKLDNYPLVLGSKAFIPGFEEGLVGAKKGDKLSLDLTFPTEYHAPDLAGAAVVFEVEVLEVAASQKAELTDELAKKFGYESAEALKEFAATRVQEDLDNASEQKLRRELFDILEKKNKFALPASMIEGEFNAIWQAFQMDLAKAGKSIADMDKSEEELKTENRALAERRVKLGLVLSKIGQENKLEIKEEDVTAEINKVVAMYPQQADQVKAYYTSPQGRNEIVGPLFEKSVCDFIYAQATITEKEIKASELLKEFA
ncbi:MAG TPA: trigger factor [Alphaproteobacteria bacterium]|nr:trigger factor [Alphaproteobacteria bacterium]